MLIPYKSLLIHMFKHLNCFFFLPILGQSRNHCIPWDCIIYLWFASEKLLCPFKVSFPATSCQNYIFRDNVNNPSTISSKDLHALLKLPDVEYISMRELRKFAEFISSLQHQRVKFLPRWQIHQLGNQIKHCSRRKFIYSRSCCIWQKNLQLGFHNHQYLQSRISLSCKLQYLLLEQSQTALAL